MLLVTEGHDLREKVEDEFSQLAQPQRSIYGAIALASEYRYKIGQDEVQKIIVAALSREGWKQAARPKDGLRAESPSLQPPPLVLADWLKEQGAINPEA